MSTSPARIWSVVGLVTIGVIALGMSGAVSSQTSNISAVRTSTTGYAVYGSAASGSAVHGTSVSGNGVYGYTENAHAVYGADVGTTQGRGYGGYFTSNTGVGVYGYSSATSHFANAYTPGVYGNSKYGVGVLASNSTDSTKPALYATNDSATSYTATIYNADSSTSPGLYVRGTLSVTAGKAGYVVDIARNAGEAALETGDAVEIVGVSEPVVGQIPVIEVRKCSSAETTRVAGVVDQPYLVPAAPTTAAALAAGQPPSSPPDQQAVPRPAAAEARVDRATAVPPGGYCSIVTLGSYRLVKADTTGGVIEPGDLLVASIIPGHVTRAVSPPLGSVVGKALGTLPQGEGAIPLLVTLK